MPRKPKASVTELEKKRKKWRRRMLKRTEKLDSDMLPVKVSKVAINKAFKLDQLTHEKRFPVINEYFSKYLIPRLKEKGIGKEKPITVNVIGAGSRMLTNITDKSRQIMSCQPEEIQRELIKAGVDYKITATDQYKSVSSALEERDKVKYKFPKIERVKLKVPGDKVKDKIKQADITVFTVCAQWISGISKKRARIGANLVDSSVKKGGYIVLYDEAVEEELLKRGYIKIKSSVNNRVNLLQRKK